MKKIKYEFTPGMAAMTSWRAQGAWQELLAREMLIAGLEWLEQERREYIGWRFWRGWWDKQVIWPAGITAPQFVNKQSIRLELDAKGSQQKTRALHQVLVDKMGDGISDKDAPVIIGTVEYTLMWILSNSWEAFVLDMKGLEKQEIAKMN